MMILNDDIIKLGDSGRKNSKERAKLHDKYRNMVALSHDIKKISKKILEDNSAWAYDSCYTLNTNYPFNEVRNIPKFSLNQDDIIENGNEIIKIK